MFDLGGETDPVVGQAVLLTVLVVAGHPRVVFLLVPHQSLFDCKFLVADVAGEGFVVDVQQDVFPQLVGRDELAGTEDAVDPSAHLVLLAVLASVGPLVLGVHLGGRLVDVLVLVVGVLVLVFYVSDHVVPGDEVLVTQMTLEIATDDSSVLLSIIILVLSVLIPQVEVEVVGALVDLEVVRNIAGHVGGLQA